MIGNGDNRFNPIHGADLAQVCVHALTSTETDIMAGGPEVFTQKQAAELAFQVLGKEPRIKQFPTKWAKRLVKAIKLINKQFGDLGEFIVTAGEVDGVAPSTGAITLKDYFEELAKR